MPWPQQLSGLVRDIDELLAIAGLDAAAAPADLAPALAAARQFPLRVTHAFASRIRPGDWRDPLLLQVLPTAAELNPQPGYSDDPLEESDANPLPGLIHKYHGRVLLTASGGCAINCRYCFRRSFPYQDNSPGSDGWRAVLDYLRARPEIDEVILSGGDPLVASDRSLAALATGLQAIPHIQRLRIHTRLPVVLPARIDDALLGWLGSGRLHPVVVIHCNHPQEIDAEVSAALLRLKNAGVTLLNQSVLLAGVNDDAAVLAQLSLRLFDNGVLPYYLHVLDRVRGAAHFDLPEARALQLWHAMSRQLPGYLLPRLAREEPGAGAKTVLAGSQAY